MPTTFRELRRYLMRQSQRRALVRWERSGIVELAQVTKTGAITITNVITRRTWGIPMRYAALHLMPLHSTDAIPLLALAPKSCHLPTTVTQHRTGS